jgi:hypothetical protein
MELQVMFIKNWNNVDIEIVESKGGVKATINPYDNLIKTNILPWPLPEVLQKLYQSNHHKSFDNSIGWDLGYYSDIQSLNSEDAMTWSYFGTLAYADRKIKVEFLTKLLKLLKLNVDCSIKDVNISLWRRIPHPDTLVSGGPEIDFIIQSEKVVLLGEAKWLSGISVNQGKKKNKDQIELRKEFLEKYSSIIFPNLDIANVLCLSFNPSNHKSALNLTWHDLIYAKIHPLGDELIRYYEWKKIYSF